MTNETTQSTDGQPSTLNEITQSFPTIRLVNLYKMAEQRSRTSRDARQRCREKLASRIYGELLRRARLAQEPLT